jgi:hypothetical protein
MSDLELLRSCVGRYAGHGIDHEDQPFHGELELGVLFDRAITLAFRATGIDGTSYHEEQSWIATDADGRLCLWSVSTNSPTCGCHVRRHGASVAGTRSTLVFGQGDPQEGDRYRAEIAIDLWPNGDLGYRFAWGMPGGAFRPRSTVKMSPAPAET